MIPPPPRSTLFPYTTLFRSPRIATWLWPGPRFCTVKLATVRDSSSTLVTPRLRMTCSLWAATENGTSRSEEHTSELQSQSNLVCRLLLEKKKKKKNKINVIH